MFDGFDASDAPAAIAAVIGTTVGPAVGWLIGRRRETSDIKVQEAARVEAIVNAALAIVDQLQEETARLAEANGTLWRQVAELQERYDNQALQLGQVRDELMRLRAQAHPGG